MSKTILGWLIGISSFAQGDIAAKVDPLFSDYNRPDVPGASVQIMQGGDILFEKGYGLRDLESSQPVTKHSNFRLASLSKQFTAMAAAILLADGKLTQEMTLQEIFSDFPDYGKRVKVGHLIHHTSGLKDYESLIPSGHTKQVLDADVLEMVKRQPTTIFAPGSRYQYSNTGYVVLAQVVEKISGVSFASFVKARIFDPLWMKRSEVYQGSGDTISERAYGYTANGSGFKRTDQSVTSATQGDGGIYTSIADLFFWNRALDGNPLLPTNLQNEIFKPGTLNNGSPVNYGFGWELGSYRGLKCFSHTGSTIGFRTAIQRYPDKQFSVLVLVNRAGAAPWDIARAIVDRILF